MSARSRKFAAGSCAVELCEGSAACFAGDLKVCNKHYFRWKTRQSFELPDRRLSPSGRCTVPGCAASLHSRNLAYCRTHYFRLRRGSKKGLAPIASECAHCGSTLNHNQSRFCSKRCGWRHQQGTQARRSCIVCGSEFDFHGTANTCSDFCFGSAIRARKQHRRALEVAPGWRPEKFFDREIFIRDNWTCQICYKPVDRFEKHPIPTAPTIDHIRPLSRGGAHIRSNVQTAHSSCNMRKSWKLVCEIVQPIEAPQFDKRTRVAR